uniref:Cytidine/uridine monophosphate kinase 1 n=1 Tax=Oncorhynchus kisutch TaxID=8019 RepID=A0A8C7I749_ONCKI
MIVGYFRLLSSLSAKVPSVVYRAATVALIDMKKAQVVFVLGGPGSGKGTQCVRIVESYGYTHLSFGQLIDNHIKDGKIVPFEITIKLLKKAMEETRKLDEKKIHFLIDGFPRNEENLHGWTTIMDGEADVKFVLFFDCSNEVIVGHWGQGSPRGKGGANKEGIQTYLQSTRPVISLYEKQGKVRTVDASYSVDKVFANVKTILDKEI